MVKVTTVDEYINCYPTNIKEQLILLRQLILTNVPEVVEKISWGAPTYYLDGYLLQFAVNKNHIGFYTTPETINHFKDELIAYKTNNKNTVQFPLNQELPKELIKQMIIFRVYQKTS